MLKIMIRENSTQRGNENFGAVLDSVGAVLMQCVRDAYKTPPKKEASQSGGQTPRQKLENGNGIGEGAILAKESGITKMQVVHALSALRSTDAYLTPLKKGVDSVFKGSTHSVIFFMLRYYWLTLEGVKVYQVNG